MNNFQLSRPNPRSTPSSGQLCSNEFLSKSWEHYEDLIQYISGYLNLFAMGYLARGRRTQLDTYSVLHKYLK
jgi:hypothetical protein